MSEAEDIVKAILEADDLDFEGDIKDVFLPGPTDWQQIGGDVHLWTYGGTLWNPYTRQLFHFDGIENEKEIEPEDVEVPPYTLAKIKAMVHDPYLDTPEGQEDPAWLEKQLKQEEWEVERKVGEYQYAKAAFLNARKQYRWDQVSLEGEEDIPSYLQQYIEPVKQQFDEETQSQFDEWPLEVKVAEIFGYTGWEQYADSVMMSQREARQFFNQKLR